MKDQKKFKERPGKGRVGTQWRQRLEAIKGRVHSKNQGRCRVVLSHVVAIVTWDFENLNVADANKRLN